MINIVDYGVGNLRSVQKSLERQGFEARITDKPDDIRNSQGLILPGVGAFADCMYNLRSKGLEEPIKDYLHSGKPFLGICVGFQLLFEYGEEDGIHEGIGFFKGRVKKFDLPKEFKVPHMGWNQIEFKKETELFKGIPSNTPFYFVHSYYVEPTEEDIITATSSYGIDFCAAVAKDNIFAIQFHPEKSSTWGLKVLNNFGRLVETQ